MPSVLDIRMKAKKQEKLTEFDHEGVVYKLKDCIQVRGEASAVPFIGQIREIEARSSGKRREVHVLVAWFYRPEEAQGGRKAFHGEKELFKSEHLDWCMATTIEGRCQVHSLRAYQALKKVEPTDYFTRFTYKPSTHEFRPDRVPVCVPRSLPAPQAGAGCHLTFGSALACLQQLSVHPEHRYCVCELPYNPDAYMVQCEACEDWFHPRCVGSTQAAVEPAASFSCPECQQAGRDAKRARTEGAEQKAPAPAPAPAPAAACT